VGGSTAANNVPASKESNRLYDVAEAAKSGSPGLEAEDTVDHAVSVAPAVTHEVVRPHQHEVIEEQISREIHTHEVHPKIQPIYDVEVRPTRHFVPDEHGGLVEVSEEEVNKVYRAREAATEGEQARPRRASPTSEDGEMEPTQRRYNIRSSPRQSE